MAEPIEEGTQDEAGEDRERDDDDPQETVEDVPLRQIASELPADAPRRDVRTAGLLTHCVTAKSRAYLDVGSDSSTARSPCSAMRPWSTTAIWSTELSDESRCATRMAVRPVTRRSTAPSTRSSVSGSRRLDGSSRITSPGSARKARARANNWASPAESP